MQMRMFLPMMSDAELNFLFGFAGGMSKHPRGEEFAYFLILLVEAEKQRRRTPGAEPGMPEFPIMTPAQCGDMLHGCVTLVSNPRTRRIRRFSLELLRKISAHCSAYLHPIEAGEIAAGEGG